MSGPQETPGSKMQYLIKRKASTSREELIAHWFANHMPGVIDRNSRNRDAGQPSATHYVATLFDTEDDTPQSWDGVAQLWYEEPLPRPAQASAVEPYDTFQEKVEPYWPWATKEYVAIGGALPLDPLTLNAPFPCTRSGFYKRTSLVAAKPGADIDAMFVHWRDIHLPNVRKSMEAVGGFRYVVSLSLEMEHAPYAGTAELYFRDTAGWAAFQDAYTLDGFEQYVDDEASQRFASGTEMVGVE
jgi:hypothetical protein